jgi:signal transduction histidine kinase
MDSPYSSQSHAERLIAIGRVVLAAFAFLAISLDPSQPARCTSLTYALLTGYLAYALLVAFLVWRSDTPLGRWGASMHVLDVVVFSLIMYFTENPTSPFFLYFVFLLLVATLRWQWRGTLWTAVAALAIYIGMGVYGAEVLRDPSFEFTRFIIRSLYLGAVAILVGYLGAGEQRVHSETSMLAAWPRTVPREAQELVGEALEHAARILGAPRALMAWQVAEDPRFHLAMRPRGELHWSRETPAAFQPLVVDPLADADFLCQDASAPVATVLYASPAGLRHWRGSPLHPMLQAWFGMKAVLSLRLRGETLNGRLFCLDKSGMTSDDLVLGEIVARLVTASMDQFYLLQGFQQKAVTEERNRLARDLHDGVLQSLTGAALQLESVRRMLEEDPEAARKPLLEIQSLIATQQRDLRLLIQGLKPEKPGPSGAQTSLAARLDELVKRVERQWGLRVEFKEEYLEPRISKEFADEIYHIVHEALINAARHANASVVRLEIGSRDNQMQITVDDNGVGFPFRGYYDHTALTDRKLGPVMLKERIASVGGSLSIKSTDSGSRLEITLPLANAGE